MFVTFPPRARRRVPLVLALAMTGVLLAGCGSLGSISSWVTPYKADVLQGNFVSLEQVQALKPGMPRQQVRDILGTPLLTSVFHAQRWDYVFTMDRQQHPHEQLKLAVFFNAADLLDHVEGDTMPTESDFVARIDRPRDPSRVPPVLEASEESLKPFAPAPVTAPPAAVTGDVPPTTYPPLEAPSR